ncbi:hypothetical protein [Halomonas sp. ATBC28]|uniref:hypothetical protein n=1 Tax=Halomonas sp. ATBC28 TaxID=2545264 RepID=UPI00110E848E|nr:hypothetical protein [Halomonas sp. ATBC28]
MIGGKPGGNVDQVGQQRHQDVERDQVVIVERAHFPPSVEVEGIGTLSPAQGQGDVVYQIGKGEQWPP